MPSMVEGGAYADDSEKQSTLAAPARLRPLARRGFGDRLLNEAGESLGFLRKAGPDPQRLEGAQRPSDRPPCRSRTRAASLLNSSEWSPKIA